MKRCRWCCGVVLALASCAVPTEPQAQLVVTAAGQRMRARDVGIHVGALAAGPLDAITDVDGVAVGHATLHEGERLHTGVTVVLPQRGNPFQSKLPAALCVQNGFGKLVGATQLMELGELESPIALCGTLNVHRVADGLLDWLLAQPGNERVRSANVVVGETNDGRLSDIRARPVGSAHVAAAIAAASDGAFEVGAVGAGAGTVCFGFKGGVGSASRVVGDFTVGVLVQSNFGGRLVVDGQPFANLVGEDHDGSCMVVIATDAPLDQRGLERLARRAFAGMARTGASFSNGSGDYAVAFSTAGFDAGPLRGSQLSPLFVAVADATEQAILDSLCAAETTTGMGRTVRALPLQPLRRHFGAAPEAAR
jgi:D-aminopeptidase